MGNIVERRRIAQHLRLPPGRRNYTLFTTHLRPFRQNFRIRFDDFTCQSANSVFAFNGYLDISVRQYMFARHRARLQHPYLPCVLERGRGSHRSYYPMEFVELRFQAPANSMPRLMMRECRDENGSMQKMPTAPDYSEDEGEREISEMENAE